MEATSHSPLLDKSVQPGIQLLDVKEEIKQTEINQVETNKLTPDHKKEVKEPEIVLNDTVFVSTKKDDESFRLYIDDKHKKESYFFCGRLHKIEKKEPELAPDDKKKPEERDICYLQFTINHISIDENYQTRNAKCLIDMIVKLYWLFDEADYKKYKSSQLSSEEKYTPSWLPVFTFYKATDATKPEDRLDEKEPFGVYKIEDFFGEQIVEQIPFDMTNDMRSEIIIINKNEKEDKNKDGGNKGKKNKKNEVDKKEVDKSRGLLNCAEYHCSLTINESFELHSFPFDCQDIPIMIEPKNFSRFVAAFCQNKDKFKKEMFMKISGEAIHLGAFNTESTLCEFKKKTSRVHVMIKLKRCWTPYMLKHVFLIFCATILSLSVFSLSAEEQGDRLGTVLTLILALIFIELPAIPIVTILHKYFYFAFLFLVIIAVHCSFGEEIEDENGQIRFAITYFIIFVVFHILFVLYIGYEILYENKKIKMSSKQIKQEVEEKSVNLVSYGYAQTESKSCTQTKDKNDLFAAYPATDDGILNLLPFNKKTNFNTQPLIWVYLVAQFVASTLLLLTFKYFNDCDSINISTNIHEIRAIFGFSVISIISYLASIYNKHFYTHFVVLFYFLVGPINYFMGVHQFVIWHPKYITSENILCNDDNFQNVQSVVFALCSIWIAIPFASALICSLVAIYTQIISKDWKMVIISILIVVYAAFQITVILLQLMELEHINNYYDDSCPNHDKNDIFINTAETYAALVPVVMHAIASSIMIYTSVHVIEVVGQYFFRFFGLISYGVMIHSFVFWKNDISSCFEQQNTLHILTLLYIILETLVWCPGLCCVTWIDNNLNL